MSQRDVLRSRFAELLDELEAAGDRSLLHELQRQFEELAGRLVEVPLAAVGEASPAPSRWHGMIGSCPPILKLQREAQKFADANAPILIRGESGTGKDVVAQILHKIGPRAKQAFVSENCAAIPHNLLESILFGHRRGAFTGAVKNHDGHFVTADKGTLFLDEIGDMPLAMQAKLLRALQEGEVRAVGATRVRKVDVRVIAATNQDLENLVAKGSFREDLYYRLNVLQLTLPPLRDRGEDIVDLARVFLASAVASSGRSLTLDSSAEECLKNAHWRGNVRQLQNEMQRAAVLAPGPRVTAGDLSSDL